MVHRFNLDFPLILSPEATLESVQQCRMMLGKATIATGPFASNGKKLKMDCRNQRNFHAPQASCAIVGWAIGIAWLVFPLHSVVGQGIQIEGAVGSPPVAPVSPVEPNSPPRFSNSNESSAASGNLTGGESKFDEKAAFGYLQEICKIGPRPSASPGMRKQQLYLQKHFQEIGGEFLSQKFQARSPYSGKLVELHNLIVRWHPKRTKRLLICCHHDTRPFADSDPRDPRARFIGANDGGSGVALLCELGKHMEALDGEYGVDFIFFDGEEFVIQRQRDPLFLGSTYFAQQYAAGAVGWRYDQAVLVDMVGDKELQIYMEGNSLSFARELTQDIWMVAKQVGVNEFVPQQRHEIRDDHLPLNQIARIPTCDIIDFDYPNLAKGNSYWHTRQDTIENCSAESLGKVGSVVLAWLKSKQARKQGN